MATVKENLIAARALIDTPDKWGKGALIVRNGCYCALGALSQVGQFNPQGILALSAGLPVWSDDIADYNDRAETTHADIMALFDRAIEAAE